MAGTLPPDSLYVAVGGFLRGVDPARLTARDELDGDGFRRQARFVAQHVDVRAPGIGEGGSGRVRPPRATRRAALVVRYRATDNEDHAWSEVRVPTGGLARCELVVDHVAVALSVRREQHSPTAAGRCLAVTPERRGQHCRLHELRRLHGARGCFRLDRDQTGDQCPGGRGTGRDPCQPTLGDVHRHPTLRWSPTATHWTTANSRAVQDGCSLGAELVDLRSG